MTDTCTYIGPEQQGPSYKPMCCNAVVKGKHYCAEHLAVVYQVGSAVRRKKDQKRYDRIKNLESLFNEAVAELEEEGFDVWGDSERLEA